MDATLGYELFIFMDVFFGYNQIWMMLENEEKTVFISDQSLFCYRIMPFGLKNVGTTYQYLINKIFEGQIE